MTTTVSQEAVEVTQADREAVAEFHRQSFETLFATTDADIDAGINRAHTLLCQAFARHRQSAERGEAWRPVEELVNDGRAIIVGCWVTPSSGEPFWSFWQTYADGGPLGEDGLHGDPATHYLYTIPTPPEAV